MTTNYLKTGIQPARNTVHIKHMSNNDHCKTKKIFVQCKIPPSPFARLLRTYPMLTPSGTCNNLQTVSPLPSLVTNRMYQFLTSH
jgi:hypothetical protein